MITYKFKQRAAKMTETKIEDSKGYIKNCFISARQGEIIFEFKSGTITCRGFEGGTITPFLDGYAIIPMEEYKELKKEHK